MTIPVKMEDSQTLDSPVPLITRSAYVISIGRRCASEAQLLADNIYSQAPNLS
jgi:hypothetical protein